MPDVSLMLELCDLLNITVTELLYGEKIDSTRLCEQAELNIMDLINRQKKLRNQKFISEMVSGGGTGLVLSQLYAPDTVSKAVVAVIGTVMIFCGWYLRYRIEKTGIWRYDDVSRDEKKKAAAQ